MLATRPEAQCRYDAISLGEVMLRFDPGEQRIRAARQFMVWEGGGEYNVVRALGRVFGLRSAVVTGLVDNQVGHLIEELMLAGGVDTSMIRWYEDDGVGRSARNGLNFTERGFGLRGAVGVSDRGHTAASQLEPGMIDWDKIFGRHGARWFHTGGIYAGLSSESADVAAEAMAAAQEHGTIVSYDLNYRPSLWKAIGGTDRAQQVNRALVEHADVLLGNEEDFTACLGIPVPDTDVTSGTLDPANFRTMIGSVTEQFPNLQVIGTTLRTVKTATVNDWGAIGWDRDGGFADAQLRQDVEILDRVGGGDSFASGLIYGLLSGHDLRSSLDLGAAHGALAMTTPGDTSMATSDEVFRLVQGASARVQR